MMKLRPKILATIAAAIGVGSVLVWRATAAETIPVSDVSHIHGIAIDRQDPSRLYLATHYGVFATGPDGTATRISDNRNDYMGFTPDPADPDAFYASGHPSTGGNMGVLVSKDGGRTWERISEGANGPVDFHAMDVSPADPKVLYGLYGDIQVSRDAGRTWEIAGPAPGRVFDIAAAPEDVNTLFAATEQGLMVSQDAGASWQPAMMERRPVTMVQSGPDGMLYAFVYGKGLVESRDKGLNWAIVSGDWGDSVLLHLAVDPSDPNRLVAVDDAGQVILSTDAGQSWKPAA